MVAIYRSTRCVRGIAAGIVQIPRSINQMRLARRLKSAGGPTRGRRETRRVRVAQVTEGYLGMSAYAEISFLSRIANESWLMNSAQMQLDGSSQRLTELYRQLKSMPAVRAVVSPVSRVSDPPTSGSRMSAGRRTSRRLR